MTEIFLKFIERANKIVLTSHESPDGDAVCSEIGLFKLLQFLNVDVKILNSDEAEKKYDFLGTNRYLQVITPGKTILPDDFSLIVLDTHPFNIGKGGDLLREKAKDVFVIDHHEDSYSHVYEGIHDIYASSTCQLVYLMMEELGFIPDKDTASALFSGIVYDTGSFQFKKTTDETFRIGGELTKLGVDPFEIHNHLDQSNSKSFLVLQTEVMKTLEFFFMDRVTFMMMSKKILTDCHARYDEAQPLINIPLICKDVEVSFLFKENENGIKRCSIRSKGNFDCYELANKYGGGGHKTAAGFKIKGSFKEIKSEVLDVIAYSFP